MIDLALLGTGGGMPMPNRYLSAALINYKGRKILIDCGEGTQVSMRILGWGFKSIDIICITHAHGDHIVGLPGLLSTIGNSGRVEPLTIIGPSGIKDIVKSLTIISPYLPYEINIIENDREIIFYNDKKTLKTSQDNKQGEIKISTVELEHSSPCIGYSFYIKRQSKFDINKAIENNVPKPLWNILQKGSAKELNGILYKPNMVLGEERSGIKISYITDTRPINPIVDFIRGSDLFICEGTYGESNDIDKAIKNKHMTFREAAKLAYDGEVNELWLTHFSSAMNEPEIFKDNATDIFNNTTIGKDRITTQLAFK